MQDEHGAESAGIGLFADAEPWKAIASGLAQLRLASSESPAGPGLRLDYDFLGGGGFVVARREVVLDFAESWEIRLLVRGEGPANTLEVKLLDGPGTSVWRFKREKFTAPGDWEELVVPSREVEFAWGPAGGGSIARAAAVEIAVVAGPGGRGFLELTDFRVVARSFARLQNVDAGSRQPGHPASMAVDGEDSTSWRSAVGDGPQDFTVDFGEERDVGGLVVRWHPEARPRTFRVEVATGEEVDVGRWRSVYEAPRSGAPISFVSLPDVKARTLRLTAWPLDAAAGIGIANFEVRPFEWSRSPTEFLTNVAMASARGCFPRYLLREQTWWTPVGSPTSGPVGLISDDAAVEVGEAGLLLEPSLLLFDEFGTRVLRWPDVERGLRLEARPLPVATVTWRGTDLLLETTPFVEDAGRDARLVVRYRLTNTSAVTRRVTLCVALRPYQVTPPWQAWRGLGGPSRISRLEWNGSVVRVNDTTTVAPLSSCEGFGAVGFDEGGVAACLERGSVPGCAELSDPEGRAEGVLSFTVELEAGARRDVFVECRLPTRPPRSSDLPEEAGGILEPPDPDPNRRLDLAIGRWRSAMAGLQVRGPADMMSAFEAAATAITHVLLCRDGAALQPGPRRYTRSWIRDGAIMSAALLRAGLVRAARSFVTWYAPFQHEDGFVPCCVDRDGVDALVEHDSHGQLIYAIVEAFRFTGDEDLARALWPHCAKAVAKIEKLRATRKTAEFDSGLRQACRGLLPESASHEGYLAHPVHSYWDDFWALRGLRDAEFLARRLGLEAEAVAAGEAARDLGSCLAESMRLVMRDRGLATVPASVEWADFDPTAIAGAVSLVGAAGLFSREALDRTFEDYLRGMRSRRDPAVKWNNYSAYEVRVVGALVRLGRRDDANELLDFLLADRRPAEWGQWPEITWFDATTPAHLGDLPHCWIGAEYAYALRSMLIYERDSDDAIVVGAGLREAWLDAGDIEAVALPTRYGPVDLAIRSDGEGGFVVTAGGAANPPGGFTAELPPHRRVRLVHRDGEA